MNEQKQKTIGEYSAIEQVLLFDMRGDSIRNQAAAELAALTERVRVLEAALVAQSVCNCETDSDNPEDHLRDCPRASAPAKG